MRSPSSACSSEAPELSAILGGFWAGSAVLGGGDGLSWAGLGSGFGALLGTGLGARARALVGEGAGAGAFLAARCGDDADFRATVASRGGFSLGFGSPLTVTELPLRRGEACARGVEQR